MGTAVKFVEGYKIGLRGMLEPEARGKLSRVHRDDIAYVIGGRAIPQILSAQWARGHGFPPEWFVVRGNRDVYRTPLHTLKGFDEAFGPPFVAVSPSLVVNTAYVRWRDPGKGMLRGGFFDDADRLLEYVTLSGRAAKRLRSALREDTYSGRSGHDVEDRGEGEVSMSVAAIEEESLRNLTAEYLDRASRVVVRRLSRYATEAKDTLGLDHPRLRIKDPLAEWVAGAGEAVESFVKSFVPAGTLPGMRERWCR
jgi:hypothetical protein